MTDQQANDGDWIAVWIARQREILAQVQQARNSAAHAADLGRSFSATGQAFFDGLRQFVGATGTPASGPTLDPFNIGDAMLGAWTGATLFQSSMAEQASDLLRRLPPIGLMREQTEAWRELAAAHAECKRMEDELRSALAKVQLDALDLLEQRVRERSPAAPIGSFRELYDLWVECGEQAYGGLAHSPAYSKLQAELGNATMRLRTRVQAVLEHGLKQLDLPTRSELNSLHRQVRELRIKIERLEQPRDERSARPPARRMAQPDRRRSKQASRAAARAGKAKARTR